MLPWDLLLKGHFDEFREQTNMREEPEKSYGLGLADLHQGKLPDACRHFYNAIPFANKPEDQLQIYAGILFAESRTGNLDAGTKVLETGENLCLSTFNIDHRNPSFERLKELNKDQKIPAIRFIVASTYFRWMKGEPTDYEDTINILSELAQEDPYTLLTLQLTRFRILVLGAHDLQVISQLQDFIDSNRDSPLILAEALNLLGICEIYQNRYNIAISYFTKSLQLNTLMQNSYMASLNRANIGSCLRREGKIREALEYLLEAEQKERTIGNSRNLPLMLENIGLCYIMGGEFDKAEEYFEEALKLTSLRQTPYVSISALYELAISKYSLGKMNQALELFQQAHDIATHQNSPIFIFNSLFYQFIILIEKDRKKALHILEELIELSEQMKHENFRKMTELANAIYLKTTSKLKNLGKAYEILERLAADDNNTNFFVNMTSNLHLLNLMLIEAKLSKTPESFQELATQIQKLKRVAEESPLLTLELKHVEARFEMLMGNVERAIETLDEGIKHANEIGFVTQQNRLKKHKKEIENELLNWVDLLAKSKSRIDLLNQSRLMDYLKSVHQIISAN